MTRKINFSNLLIAILILLCVFTSCKTTKRTIVEEYSQLDKNHVYVRITINELKNKINDQETFFIVMGFPKCSWCQELMAPLNEVAKTQNVKKIYYLDIKEIRDNVFAKGYKEFKELSNTVFSDALVEQTKKINSPTTMRIENGVLTQYHIGTVNSHIPNERGVLEPLTTIQKEELSNILKDLLRQS